MSGVGQVVLSAPLGSGRLGGPRGAVGGWAHVPLSCTMLLGRLLTPEGARFGAQG